MAVDPKARVIVAVRGEGADSFEGEAVGELLDRARFQAPTLESFAADRGYAAKAVWQEAERRGLDAYVPPLDLGALAVGHGFTQTAGLPFERQLPTPCITTVTLCLS